MRYDYQISSGNATSDFVGPDDKPSCTFTGMEINGDRLRELRKERGWSQTALGKLIGRSQQAISQWETGHTNEPGALLKLAKVFNVPVDEFMNGQGWPDATDTAIIEPDAEHKSEWQMHDVYRLIGILQNEVEHLKGEVKELKTKLEIQPDPHRRRRTS